MSSGCGDVLSLEDLKTAKKHQTFEAEVITGKAGGVASGADIEYATNQVTGQVQKTLPAVLRDAGFSPVSWDFSTGGILTVNDRDKVVYDPVSKTWYSYAGTLPVTVPAGFNPVGNVNWKPQTDPDLRNELASSTGGSLVSIKKTGLSYNLSTNLSDYYQTTPINAVTDYGLVPDFDPSLGVANGTNNTEKMQDMLDEIVSVGGNVVVIVPPGKYYFNFDSTTNIGGTGILWGRVGSGLKNVTFLCYGATFYSGSIGRFNGIFSANRGVKIKGLSVVGYAGGTLAPTRERDACFVLNYNCNGVDFEDCDFSNSLGDCVYLGGSLVDGGETGYFGRDISFRNCVFKERWGNGVRSYSGGSRSRLAMAVIDIVGLKITNCTFYGEIDIEPNLDNQRLQHIKIHDNEFRAGNVLPYTGTNPWAVEGLYTGSQVIRGGILIQSRAGSSIATGVTFGDNYIEYGRISIQGTDLSNVVVNGNRFYRGIMQLGFDSGSNNNQGIKIFNNHIDLGLNGSNDDLDEDGIQETIPTVVFWLRGNTYNSVFHGNTAGVPAGSFSYMFYYDPNSVAADSGRNTYMNNYLLGAGSLFNTNILDSSIQSGNIVMPSTGYPYSNTSRASEGIVTYSTKAVPLAASGAIDWRLYAANYWDITPSSASLSLTNITNAPVGAEVMIRATTNTPLILAHGTTFYMKGAVNATLDDTRKMVRMRQIALNNWSEISRNF